MYLHMYLRDLIINQRSEKEERLNYHHNWALCTSQLSQSKNRLTIAEKWANVMKNVSQLFFLPFISFDARTLYRSSLPFVPRVGQPSMPPCLLSSLPPSVGSTSGQSWREKAYRGYHVGSRRLFRRGSRFNLHSHRWDGRI